MKSTWQDVTLYRGGEEHVPRAWDIHLAGIRLTVHRHFDWPPDVWLFSVDQLDIRNQTLQARDEDEAKTEALGHLRIAVGCILDAIKTAQGWF